VIEEEYATDGRSYGIVANVIEDADKLFRDGAKVWIAGGTGGAGWERFEFFGKSIGGRDIRKWAPTSRFDNFRAAWIPEHLREEIRYMTGSRRECERRAAELDAFAVELRNKPLTS
jgi:hypothetical protein